MLLHALCHLHNVEIPNEADVLMHGESSNAAASSDDFGGMDQKEADESDDIDAMEIDSDDEATELDDSLFVVSNIQIQRWNWN